LTDVSAARLRSDRVKSASGLQVTAVVSSDAEGIITRHRLNGQYNLKIDNSVTSGFDYQLGAVGNRTALREATGVRTTWTYDLKYQLINEHRWSTVGGFNTTHVYDPMGTRLIKNEAGVLTTSGTTTSVWNFENERTLVLLPSGQRATMAYNADFRCVYKEP
jgi:YD repeat-containing protein